MDPRVETGRFLKLWYKTDSTCVQAPLRPSLCVKGSSRTLRLGYLCSVSPRVCACVCQGEER
jgi:hypothetical protein